jgi:hypothetical protein
MKVKELLFLLRDVNPEAIVTYDYDGDVMEATDFTFGTLVVTVEGYPRRGGFVREGVIVHHSLGECDQWEAVFLE